MQSSTLTCSFSTAISDEQQPPSPSPAALPSNGSNKALKREDTPHPVLQRSRSRLLMGKGDKGLIKAQVAHSKSESAYAHEFHPPMLCNSPRTTPNGTRQSQLECKSCAMVVLRPLNSSLTDKLKEHLERCRARLAATGQQTLGQAGIQGVAPILADEVIQVIVCWAAEDGRPFRITHDRQVGSVSPRSAAQQAHAEIKMEQYRIRVLRKLFHPIVQTALLNRTHCLISDSQHKLYNLMTEVVKAQIKELPGALYIGTDAWTAPNGAEVAGFVLFGRDKANKLVELPLDFKMLTSAHTGEYLAEVTLKLICKYEMRDRVIGVVSDSAATMRKAMILLGEKGLERSAGLSGWLRCFAHVLNLITKAILSPFKKAPKAASTELDATMEEPEAYEPTFEEIVTRCLCQRQIQREDAIINLDLRVAQDAAFAQLLKEVEEEEGDSHLQEREESAGAVYTAKSAKLTLAKFHQLVRTLRYSGKARRAWEECAGRLGTSTRRVRRTGKTRWNEHLEQCKDIVEMEKLIIEYQKHGSLPIKPRNRLGKMDFRLVRDLVAVLEPLASLTSLVSTAKMSRLGDAIWWIDELSALFDDILTTPSAQPPALHNAVLRGWRMLQKYYSFTDDSQFYRVALLLHPSLRLSYMKNAGWAEDWIATAVEVAEEMYGNYKRDDNVGSAQSEEMPPPPPKRSRVAAHLACAALAPSHTSSDPLQSFINDSPLVNADKSPKDPFAYWIQEREAGREHGGLTELALDLFSAPISSVAVERAFSVGRAFVTEKRHGLAARSICEGLALGAWSRADMVPERLLADSKEMRKAGKVKMSGLKAVGVADGLRTPLETSAIVVE
ncbi:hypothetical protein NBRC10513_007119 [Rhodotorula toruloides]